MRLFFYNFSTLLVRLALPLIALFSPKLRLFVKGRKGLLDQIQRSFHGREDKLAWFHCASLGEFEQARPVIEAFRQTYLNYKVLLTFFSPSGYEIRKNYEQADYIFYLPLDTASNARIMIEAVQPEIAFFVKYEFWYHFSKELHNRNIPLISFSTIFRKEQAFFKSYGGFNRSILKHFDYFFVQNNTSAELLESIGLSNCSVTGDTRFDRVVEISKKAKAIPEVEAFTDGKQTMIIGSSWKEDIEVLAPLIREHQGSMKFIIAPHEIDDASITKTEELLGITSIRFSTFESSKSESANVLIIDNIGMLSSLYQYGQYAYIGGAFGDGLHNILEAATFGLPIFFGNRNYTKFQEAVDLIALNGAFAIGDFETLKTAFDNLQDKNTYEQSKAATLRYVSENTGATEKIMQYCKELLSA
ncbi:MAG: glycosyltransferase N-terminal domain-containing protein [Bacteroidota bacterium]